MASNPFNPFPGAYQPGGWEGNKPISEWGGRVWVGSDPFTRTHYGDYLGDQKITTWGSTPYIGDDPITNRGSTYYRGDTKLFPK